MIKRSYSLIVSAIILLLPLLTSTASGTKVYDAEALRLQTLTTNLDGTVQLSNEFQLLLPSPRAFSPSTTSGAGDDPADPPLQYEITSVAPVIIRNNDVVTVAFKSGTPAAGDWVAAFSTPTIDAFANAAAGAPTESTIPIKFAFCARDPHYIATGEGRVTFNITNVRADVVFKMYKGGLELPVLVAEAADAFTVQFEDANEPLRPRIVPVGSHDLDTFKLLWSSAHSTAPTVRWGTEPGVYTHHAVAADTQRIERGQLCGPPANGLGWRDLGLIHTARLHGMAALAGRTVYYTFGDDNSYDFSREHSFTVPPLPGTQPPGRPTTVILYDDMGRGSSDDSFTWHEYGRPAYATALAVGAEAAAGMIDAVYHGGDISYACGYLAVWDHFLNMISPIASSVLYLTTVGNHESDAPNTNSYYRGTDSGGECGVLATTLLPQPAPATAAQPWWSYDVGLIHFVGMSTEHDYRAGSEQYLWLDADLALVNRELTPWVIFGGHRPMYINSGYSEVFEAFGAPADVSGTAGGTGSNSATTAAGSGGGSGGTGESGKSGPLLAAGAGAATATATATDVERSPGDIEVMNMLIKHVEPLLMKHQVNLAFYGHNHAVQRQSAVYQKKVVQRSVPVTDERGVTVNLFRDPEATVHMVIGTAGAAFTQVGADYSTKFSPWASPSPIPPWTHFTQNAFEPPPEWNEQYFYKWGYARVTAVNASYLSWDWVESATGVVWDRMAITQSDDWAAKPKWTNAKPLIAKDSKAGAKNKIDATFSGIAITDFAAFFAGGFVVAAFVVFFLLEFIYGFFSAGSNEYKVVRMAEVMYVNTAREYTQIE